MDFQSLRNSFIIGSLGTSFTGLILLASPYSQFSQFLIASGLGSLAASNLAIENCANIASRKIGKKQGELDTLKGEVNHFAGLLTAKHDQLISTAEELQAAIEARANLFNDYQLLENELEEISEKLTATEEQLKNNQQLNLESAIATLQESLTEVTQQVNNLIPYLVKKYKLDVKDLLKEYQIEVKDIQAQIKVLAGKNTLTNEELISACLAIQHDTILKGCTMRAKMYKLAIDDLQMKLCISIPMTLHNEKLLEVKTFYLGNIKSIQQEFGQVADSCISAYKQDFSEVVNDGLTQSQELEQAQQQIANLQNQLSDLSKPLQFVGTSESARVGNAIINYYHQKLGLNLDGIDFTATENGYKLMFHLSRNNRFIATDTLNDGTLPEKLKELSGSLNIPKFTQSDRGNYVTVDIQLKSLPKKISSEEEIKRLVRPASELKRIFQKQDRIRITGGSGAGKSPLCQLLAGYICEFRKSDDVRLYNPQSGSHKDYWQFSTTGHTADDSKQGIDNLLELVGSKYSGDYQVYIFDEIDTVLGGKREYGIKLGAISKAINHTNLAIFMLGQNANCTNYGLQRSDLNNIISIHIGSNSFDALTNTNSDYDVAKLKQQCQMISDYYDEKNKSLGLERSEPGYYRWALVDEFGDKRYFIELPSFTENISVDIRTENIPASQLICPSCGSDNLKRNGKVAGNQRYKCNSCNKSWN